MGKEDTSERSRQGSAQDKERETAEQVRPTADQLRAEARTLMQNFDMNVLPPPPQIAGYHTMWASLETKSGHPKVYAKLKYSPISYAEVPEWEKLSSAHLTGEYANYVTCNEMVALKIPLEMYQVYMEENHYLKPQRKEQAIREAVQGIRDRGSEHGVRVFEDTDQSPIDQVRRAPRPNFVG